MEVDCGSWLTRAVEGIERDGNIEFGNSGGAKIGPVEVGAGAVARGNCEEAEDCIGGDCETSVRESDAVEGGEILR